MTGAVGFLLFVAAIILGGLGVAAVCGALFSWPPGRRVMDWVGNALEWLAALFRWW